MKSKASFLHKPHLIHASTNRQIKNNKLFIKTKKAKRRGYIKIALKIIEG